MSEQSLATVVACWFAIITPTINFVKWSILVRMYMFPCRLLGWGPVTSRLIRSHGWPRREKYRLYSVQKRIHWNQLNHTLISRREDQLFLPNFWFDLYLNRRFLTLFAPKKYSSTYIWIDLYPSIYGSCFKQLWTTCEDRWCTNQIQQNTLINSIILNFIGLVYLTWTLYVNYII